MDYERIFNCKLCDNYFKRCNLVYCKKCEETHCSKCSKISIFLINQQNAEKTYKCDKCSMYYFYASVSVITGWSMKKEKWTKQQYSGAFSTNKYPTKSEIIRAVTSEIYNDGDIISYSNLTRFQYEALL